ncbi:MAG: cytochrome bc complex cytochrome b subunit [Nitrospiraceae bacterium]|nr:MAG: cytochrome bc complex cytochrome b subunit [Nitrospiraceae bacterium]
MWQKLKDGIEIRIGLTDLIENRLRQYRVPSDTNIFYTLGIVTMAAYVVQAITGYFLLMYYVPHSEHAFRSVQDIMTIIPFGWFVRMVHMVAANLMVALLFIHFISIFFMGSYKKPREITWLAGGLLLLVTLAFCLSGYLLPWSQRSYWATTIVSNLPTAFPVIGDALANLLRGGDSVTGVTLTRFFSLHVGFLPPVFLSIVGLHIFLVWRIGLSVPPLSQSAEEESEWTEFRHATYSRSYPFYPNFLLKEVSMIMLFLAVTFFIMSFMPTLFLPEAATTPADPLNTPADIKPEWYFLAPYQMLKMIPNKFLGISLQIIAIIVFLFWPFFDTRAERNIMKRPLIFGLFLVLLALWFLLTYWGRYSA